MNKVLIIAPHLDDELIGCWSVFQNPENEISVVWLYELTPERVREGIGLKNSDNLKAKIDKLEFEEGAVLNLLEDNTYDEIYVPSRKDKHLDHKKANSIFRKHATHFYSVDMVGGKYIGQQSSNLKWEALNHIYWSQSQLWKSNASYYLFEAITQCDYDEYKVMKHQDYMITYPATYNRTDLKLAYQKFETPEDLMEHLMQHCITGKITVQYMEKTLIAEA